MYAMCQMGFTELGFSVDCSEGSLLCIYMYTVQGYKMYVHVHMDIRVYCTYAPTDLPNNTLTSLHVHIHVRMYIVHLYVLHVLCSIG